LKKNEKQRIIDRTKKEIYKEVSALLNEQAESINQLRLKISAAVQMLGMHAADVDNDEVDDLFYNLSEILLVKRIDPLSLDVDKLREIRNRFHEKYTSKNYSSQE